ncbi:MAG: NADH-quinone oxidoreductase subunit J [Candidatus Melainabacteria bacterium]|nr:NADH-quinone oxidoreductase subunit J [Candidatus Melainabacteria bacterium]
MLGSLLAAPIVETWLFYLFATMAIVLAVGVLVDRVVIRSGFILIGVFGSIAALFLLLSAQFLALAQVMIYAVAITLVIVIALMLTNPRMEDDTIVEKAERMAGPAQFFLSVKQGFPLWVSVIIFSTIYVALTGEKRWPVSTEPVAQDVVKVLGEQLTTTYAIPFEFASVLLLAALMGAIMLAKNEKKEVEPTSSEDQKAEENLALSR